MCRRRKRDLSEGLAKTVMDTADPDLDINTRKLKTRLRADFAEAAASGMCPARLFVVASALRRKLKADVQEIEGINSLIRIQGERSPHISLELLSSRICIKKALGVGSSSSLLKLSALQASANKLMDSCLRAADSVDIRDIVSEQRWAPPPRLANLPEKAAVDSVFLQMEPSANLGRSAIWAASCSLLFNRLAKDIDCGRKCVCIGSARPGSSVYIAVDKSRKMWDMSKWIVGEIGALTLERPILVLPIAAVFEPFYKKVHHDGSEPSDSDSEGDVACGSKAVANASGQVVIK